jgi:hypothetical protein
VPFDDEAKERVHKVRDRKTLIVPSLKKFTIKPGFDLRFTPSKRTFQKSFPADRPALTGRRWTGHFTEASNVAGGARKGARLRMVGLPQNIR